MLSTVVPKINIVLLCCFQKCSERKPPNAHMMKHQWIHPIAKKILDWTLSLQPLATKCLDSFQKCVFLATSLESKISNLLAFFFPSTRVVVSMRQGFMSSSPIV